MGHGTDFIHELEEGCYFLMDETEGENRELKVTRKDCRYIGSAERQFQSVKRISERWDHRTIVELFVYGHEKTSREDIVKPQQFARVY